MGTEGMQDVYINPIYRFRLQAAFRHGNEQGTSYQLPERASVQGKRQ